LREWRSENGNIYVNCKGFDLDLTLDCGQAFRRVVDASQDADGTVILRNVSESDFLNKWDIYFDFQGDYEAIKEQFRADPVMKKALDFCGGIRILKQDEWETLISFIISSNNNIPRIKGIIKKLAQYFGHFPTPEDLLATDLSFTKAGFRIKYLLGTAKMVTDGFDLMSIHNMTTAAAREALMKLPGVGPKVAECTLLYGFHRLECFPKDVWINRALKEFYPDGFPFINHPYAGIAQQFLFHYIRNTK
jgi:N-glycosylase/DNA lyase